MEQADQLLIPLLDGTHSVAQVAYVRGSAVLLFMTTRIATPRSKTKAVYPDDVLAILAVDAAALDPQTWPVFGYDALPHDLAIDRTRLDADSPLLDPAIVEAFANAVHGLYPWDGFPDPDYFTNMLRGGESAIPKAARKTADLPKPS